ncbi:MAG TPA: hypothetical protein VM911_19450 [Pyrinomonadaceae bacterium]|nr:hypothetical protein [Pyrinomonadaceae bacterium]
MPGHIPISDCEICAHLSSHNYVDLRYNSPIPDHIAILTGTSVTARPAQDIIECHLCGSCYAYTYTCGFTENDIELRRITPVEAGREIDLEAYVSDLSSPHQETRGYAAQCLVEYYLSKGLEGEAGYLLSHEDEIIRSYAEASRKYYLYHQSLKS